MVKGGIQYQELLNSYCTLLASILLLSIFFCMTFSKNYTDLIIPGYISHGLGAVKCFYPNPEAAEKFLADGLQSLGELTFVRWQDLLPTEMGPLLYKELVEMCQNYNSETKFVLYISLCVVSETPASGAVKWERQLVSRCAKLRLSKDLNFIGR